MMRWLVVWTVWSAWAQNNQAMRAALEKQRAAAQIQRESTRQQAELAGPGPLEHRLAPLWTPPACEPIADAALTALLDAVAQTQQLEARLLRAVIEQESGFYPCAVSVHGAKGLMQLMPATIGQFAVSDPFDPKQNVEAGAKYLRQLLNKYKNDRARALAAYRIGAATVDEANGIPDLPEVRSYVNAILQSVATPPAPLQTPTPKPTGN